MPTLSPEKLEELKAAHGEILLVSHPKHGDFAFSNPGRAQYKAWMRQAQTDTADANEKLALATVVFPSKEEFLAIIDKRPAVGILCGDKVALEATGSGEVETKKFE